MNARLSLILCMTLLVFACEHAVQKSVEPEIEDKSTELASNKTTDEASVQAYGTDQNGTAGISALDDPESLLATKIIYFDYDNSDIKPEYQEIVKAHAGYLAVNPNTSVTLEGHADERGSREYNLALGERRAQSIERRLTLLGASAEQIRVVSYGEERPVIEEHDDSAWSQNRRVEIIY